LEENAIGPRLDKPILIKVDENSSEVQLKNELLRSKVGYLESNFDRSILKLVKEAGSWLKLKTYGVVVPPYADEVL